MVGGERRTMTFTVQIGRPIGPFPIISDFRTDPRTAWAPKPVKVEKAA